MKCPRCQGPIPVAPDESGYILCAQCGARLRSRATAVVKIPSAPPRVPVPEPPPPDRDSVVARLEAPVSPSATLPPGTPLKKIPRRDDRPSVSASSLDALLEEIRAVRLLQEEILAFLHKQAARAARAVTAVDDPFPGFEDESDGTGESEGPAPVPVAPAPVRSRKRKTVLLIDDDANERSVVVQAFEQADVPVRTAVDGNGGLAAIAAEKPDVIVLELGLRGSMAGKDVINMIKATMEWVDIPIVLYTRMPIASQKEARIEHGADDFIPKGSGGPSALISKVVALFRRS